LHGSMSSEVIPELVLRAFIKTYPELFPTNDLTYLGLIPDPEFGWPIGISRRDVKHLGDVPAVGINCAACHVAQISSRSSSAPLRILGVTGPFECRSFHGSVVVAAVQTARPTKNERILGAYNKSDPKAIEKAMANPQEKNLPRPKEEPFRRKENSPGELHNID